MSDYKRAFEKIKEDAIQKVIFAAHVMTSALLALLLVAVTLGFHFAAHYLIKGRGIDHIYPLVMCLEIVLVVLDIYVFGKLLEMNIGSFLAPDRFDQEQRRHSWSLLRIEHKREIRDARERAGMPTTFFSTRKMDEVEEAAVEAEVAD